jgi:RNA ligase
MNYEFPIIRTIDDVLPHIKDREEFIIAEREFGTVINYQVEMPDTFPPIKVSNGSPKMCKERALTNAMRRECRGIIFDKTNKIMSRPFHKFFNINQHIETQMQQIDITQPHSIMEKMDGSMIRPIFVKGELRLATKMGVTAVSEQAEEWLILQSGYYKEWLQTQLQKGITPIFEWVSPLNQIVLAYEQPDLVYLGSRDNITGNYFNQKTTPFTCCPTYGSVKEDLGAYVALKRKAKDCEGVIIRFNDGHMLKAKNDWYVRIHKVLDKCRFDRNIIELILNEELDDVVGMVPVDVSMRMRKLENLFWKAFKQKENRLYGLRIACQQSYGDDRKQIALKLVPTLKDKTDASFIFKMLKEKNIRNLMLEHVQKSVNSNTKWETCSKWLGMS